MSTVQQSDEAIYMENEQTVDVKTESSDFKKNIDGLADVIFKCLGQIEEKNIYYQQALLRETEANFRLSYAKLQLEKMEKENEKLKEELEVMKLTSQLQEDVAKMRVQKEPVTEEEAMQLVMKALEEQGNARRVTEKILDEAVKQKTGADLLNKLFVQ